MVKRVAILTSGGDAPGMNACVRSVIRTGLSKGLEMFVVYEGYKGLVEGKIEQVDRSFVSDIINRGGTILHSARLEEFKSLEVREIAVSQLKHFNIDSLVVIGGDGTYRGAKDLTDMGINTIGIPATIDNDVASSDYSIGFDTCLNTICSCVDKIRDTTASHQRCTLIEVMGNKCGDLALFSGLAEGVEMIITKDHFLEESEVMAKLGRLQQGKKKHSLIIVSEKLYPNIHDLAKKINHVTGIETRAEVLGHLQRGGVPTAFDRVLATRFGVAAIYLLINGKNGVCVGMVNNSIVNYPFSEALQLPRNKHENLIQIVPLVNK